MCFYRAAGLVTDLLSVQSELKLSRFAAPHCKQELLMLDEFGCVRDNLVDVLQSDGQRRLPVRERRHQAICQPDPPHASPNEDEPE